MLINKHLKSSDSKFVEFFRLTQAQFAKVSLLIEMDITTEPTKFCPRPISPSEKLAVTLRYLCYSNKIIKLLNEIICV